MIGRELWDITPIFEGKPPRLKQRIVCPVCGNGVIYFKHASGFYRGNGQYRLDIAVKCGRCAYVMVFGVHITEEEFNKLSKSKVRLEYKDIGHVNLNEEVV